MSTSAKHRGTPPGNRRASPGPAGRRARGGSRRLRTVAIVVGAALAAVLAAVAGFVLVIRAATASSPGRPPAKAGAPAAGSGAGGAVKAHRPPGSPAGLPKLSAAQLAGQRVIYSYPGLTPPPSLLRWIGKGEVGGVIFFAQNISSEAQIASVIAELNHANASPQNPLRKDPLLLMTDQEGGEVRRLPGEPVLSEKQIGESARPAAEARAAGTGAGKNLAGVLA